MLENNNYISSAHFSQNIFQCLRLFFTSLCSPNVKHIDNKVSFFSEQKVHKQTLFQLEYNFVAGMVNYNCACMCGLTREKV